MPNGVELSSSEFGGGVETNTFLIRLGFKIESKSVSRGLLSPDQIEMVPEKPFTNLDQLYDLMKILTGTVLILDKHFDENGFKFLKELEPSKVREIRILTGKSHLDKILNPNPKPKHFLSLSSRSLSQLK